MSLIQRLGSLVGPQSILRAMRFYPPYLGAGVVVAHCEDDLSRIDVRMKLRPWNRNYVGTQFGGSLYSMCDPFFMLMVMFKLGPGYTVWDKSAQIEFLKPGRGTVEASFLVPAQRVDEIRAEVEQEGKARPSFETTIRHLDGQEVARITKVLSVRKKTSSP